MDSHIYNNNKSLLYNDNKVLIFLMSYKTTVMQRQEGVQHRLITIILYKHLTRPIYINSYKNTIMHEVMIT